MRLLSVLLCVLVSGSAYAQPAPPPAPAAPPAPWVPGPSPLGAFLEQRVADELAASGTPLSRTGVALRIEAVGDQLTIALVDPTTQQVIVSTVAVALADREATVASLVPVAASLVQRMSSAAPGADVAAALEAERAERRKVDEGERAYREQAISFGDDYRLIASGQTVSLHRTWVAYTGGELRKRLEGKDFYLAVHRPDLADDYDTRRNVAIGVTVASLVAVGVSMYLLVGPGRSELAPPPNLSSCGLFDDACVSRKFAEQDAQQRANEDAAKPYFYGSLALAGASAIAMGVALFYFYNPNPISENEAKDLAAEHNADLRRQLGLPGRQARSGRPHPRTIVVAPYLDHASGGGGFALTGRF